MTKSKLQEMKIGTLDDIFSTEEDRQANSDMRVANISLGLIDDFNKQPFKVRMDDEMAELVSSINNSGVLQPALVRPKGDRYEMICGHRRKVASELANIDTIPAVIRNLGDDEAIILLVDSNLHRTNITISEKAWAYRLKNDALKHQGQRDNATSRPLGGKWSITQLASQHEDSERTIQRYIRLTYLIPELLEMVDNNKMSLRPAVELSFLKDNEQKDLLETIISEEATPSMEQANIMHQLSKTGELNIDKIFELLSQEKPNQKEKIVIQYDRVNKYFPRGATPKEIEETIVHLLEQWSKQKLRKKEHVR